MAAKTALEALRELLPSTPSDAAKTSTGAVKVESPTPQPIQGETSYLPLLGIAAGVGVVLWLMARKAQQPLLAVREDVSQEQAQGPAWGSQYQQESAENYWPS